MNINFDEIPESYKFSKEERICKALGRKVNFHHETMSDILNELLTYVEQYQREYQATVGALKDFFGEEKK